MHTNRSETKNFSDPYLLGFQTKEHDTEEKTGTRQDLWSHFKDFPKY